MTDFAASINRWYRLNKRELPWREDKNPYFVWLSEIMLQQTRVVQATDYFNKFKINFPTVNHLAAAHEDEVLRLWQGLGYYSRARNLHAAAKHISNELKGKFPSDHESIMALKGVGEYTAAAIGSISFNLPYAVIDGNVYRVLSRYFGIEIPIDTTEGKKRFKELANEVLITNDPGTHNQAIMEFGALQCVPKNPRCDNCILEATCSARINNQIELLPKKSKKVKVTKRYLDYFVVTDGKSVLMKKRAEKDIWQGLYDFPCRDSRKNLSKPTEEIASFLPKTYFLDGSRKHILTHQSIEANFWIIETTTLEKFDFEKVMISKLDDIAKPQLLVKYLSASPYFSIFA